MLPFEDKVTFSRYYNRRHNRRGYYWGDRFKRVIVDRRETLVNCLAYIGLNPLRVGIVKQPEKYRWNTIGYHLQTGDKDHRAYLLKLGGSLQSMISV